MADVKPVIKKGKQTSFGTPVKSGRKFEDFGQPKDPKRPKGINKISVNVLANDPQFPDLRKPSQTFNTDVYDSLINLILNHKMELKKMPSLMTTAGAQKYANSMKDQNGNPMYRLQTEDLNGDGEKDIILYDRAGKPVIINGYKAKSSDFGMINAYRQELPFESQRKAAGGLDGWVRGKYGYQPGEHEWNDGSLENDTVPEFEALKQRGYRIQKPSTKKSFNAIFTSIIAKALKPWFVEYAEKNGLSPEISKIIRPLPLYRILFMLSQELPVFKTMNIPNYDSFKKILSKNKSYMEAQQEKFIEYAMRWEGNIPNTYIQTLMVDVTVFDGKNIINLLIGDGEYEGVFQNMDGEYYKIDNDNFPVGWQNRVEDQNVLRNQEILRNRKAFIEHAREDVDANLKNLSNHIKDRFDEINVLRINTLMNPVNVVDIKGGK